MTDTRWERVVRVGTPKAKYSQTDPSAITISFDIKLPLSSPDWEQYFKSKARELGISPQFNIRTGQRTGGYVFGNEAELETIVAAIDEAIDYANDRYEDTVIPALKVEAQVRAREKDIAQQRQDALDERAARLAKPDPDEDALNDYRNL